MLICSLIFAETSNMSWLCRNTRHIHRKSKISELLFTKHNKCFCVVLVGLTGPGRTAKATDNIPNTRQKIDDTSIQDQLKMQQQFREN